jgi:hypothetical protein
MSYRQRGESGELTRLFGAINDPGHRRAIIDLVRAVAVGEEHSDALPKPVSQNPSVGSNGLMQRKGS